MKERMKLAAAVALLAALGIIGLLLFDDSPTAYSAPGSNAVEIKQVTAFDEISVAQFTPMAGWSFQYSINPRFVTTSTVAGTVTVTNSMATLSTGAGANQSATLYTDRKIRYLPGYGGLARFTAKFTTCTAGSSQIIGIGDASNGFFFGCNGATFGILRRSNGVDTWTAQSAWTGTYEPMTTNLDTTKGNVYQIRYQWLGFGEILFYVENPTTGQFELVHRIQYANNNTVPSVLNPQLPIYASVANTTNDTDVVLQSPSAIGGAEGKIDHQVHPLTLVGSEVTSDTVTTLENVITISNTTTFNSKTNAIQVEPSVLTLAADGNQSVKVYGYVNTALGGTPSFTAHDAGNSVVYYDTAGSTVTGGDRIFAVTLAKTDSIVLDLKQFGIFLNPGETLTIAASSGVANSVQAAITWDELF